MGNKCCPGPENGTNSSAINIDDNKLVNNEIFESNLLVWKNSVFLDKYLSAKSLPLIFELTNNYEIYTNKFSDIQNKNYILSYIIPAQTFKSINKNEIQNKLKKMGFKKSDYIYWIKNVFEKDSKYITIINDLKNKNNNNNVHIGLLNHNLQQIKKVNEILENNKIKLFAVKNNFNILNRFSSNKILDYCRDKNIHFFSYNIYEEGILSGKYDTLNPIPRNMKGADFYNSQIEKIEKLNEIIKSKDYQDKQIPIIYNISKGTIPIIDINDDINIQKAIKSIDIPLSGEEMAFLERNIDMVDINLLEEI